MKRIKNFVQFKQDFSINEELFGLDKIWRNITGETKKRIESTIEELRQLVDLYNPVVKKLQITFGGETVKKFLLKKYQEALSTGLKNVTEPKNKEFIKNFFEILNYKNGEISATWKKDLPEKLRFLSEYNETQFRDLGYAIGDVINEIRKNFLFDLGVVSEGLMIINCVDIFNKQLSLYEEVGRIVEYIKHRDLLLYYLNYFQSKLSFDTTRIARFVKSLILKLEYKKTKKIKIASEDLFEYSKGSIGNPARYSYDDDFGLDYAYKFKLDNFNKKVSELNNYQRLMSQLSEFEERITIFFQNYDKLRSKIFQDTNYENYKEIVRDINYGTNFVYNDVEELKTLKENIKIVKEGIYKSPNKYLELNLEENPFRDLKYSEDFYTKRESGNEYGNIDFDFKKYLANLRKFEKEYSEKYTEDILRNGADSFEMISIFVTEDRDTPYIKHEDGVKKCGNVFYHGSIHRKLDQPGQIKELINRTGEYQMKYAGYGLFCTTFLSAACQYAFTRSYQAADRIGKSDGRLGTTIYKIVVKPGQIFEENQDTGCDETEVEYYQDLGLLGYHSGEKEVGGGETQETNIINPDGIISVTKLSISDLEEVDESLWARGSRQSKKEFLDWYKKVV